MMGKGGPMVMPCKADIGTPMMGGPQMGMMGGKPGMGPMGAMAGKGMPPQQPAPPQRAQAPAQKPSSWLNAATLAAAPPAVLKQMIGKKLYSMISNAQPELAGKITGMILEMDNSELLILLESEALLKAKVDEAMRVLVGRS
eukprot:TRINITY_DN14621_c1_g1_i1.p2 TRINITY_DN14621_c1_g1~~TRINITY_DN14621_c1_g1_i1.p2  ORF type:complete len:142 (-),score=39.19 TRINITY_DN14621_c1_g1_i1:29-454(-)